MNFPNGVLPQMDNLHLLTGIPVHEIQEKIVDNIQRTRKRFNRNLDLYLSDSESGDDFLQHKIRRRNKKQEQESIIDEDEEMENDANRIHYLDQEISRLQNLCRENFSVIDSLRKENAKLMEIQSELRETTTDLAYSLAQCPWWERDEFRNTALQILTSYTQNMQYILELPTFMDPVEQLETSGRSKEKAIQLLRKISAKKVANRPQPKLFLKCRKCNKYFTTAIRFKNHSAIHSSQKKLGCKTCGHNFTTFLQLRQHHLIHVDNHNPSPNKTLSDNSSCIVNVCQFSGSVDADVSKEIQVEPDSCGKTNNSGDFITLNGDNRNLDVNPMKTETMSMPTEDKLNNDVKIILNVESESPELNDSTLIL